MKIRFLQHLLIMHLTPPSDQDEQPQLPSTSSAAQLSTLLQFQRLAVEQLLEEDGLCVLAPGLGLHQLLAVLLQLQDTRLRESGESGTAIIIGSNPWQRQSLRKELARIDETVRERSKTTKIDFPAEVTADIPLQQRLELYRTQSCVFATTRILVVDLLTGRLEGGSIAGIYVLNAHRYIFYFCLRKIVSVFFFAL